MLGFLMVMKVKSRSPEKILQSAAEYPVRVKLAGVRRVPDPRVEGYSTCVDVDFGAAVQLDGRFRLRRLVISDHQENFLKTTSFGLVAQIRRALRGPELLRGAERRVHPVGAARLGPANEEFDRLAGGSGFELVEPESVVNDLPALDLGALGGEVLTQGDSEEVEPTAARLALRRKNFRLSAGAAEVGLVEEQEHDAEELRGRTPTAGTADQQRPLSVDELRRELDIALSQHLAFLQGTFSYLRLQRMANRIG